MPITGVVLDRIVVQAGDTRILDDISLTVRTGELLSIIGPSGSGKTTLLRAVAGLDALSSGAVHIDGVDVTTTPSRGRDVAMVFQDSVLYPFMNAERNVAWPLKVRDVPQPEIDERVHAEGRALDIDHLLDRWPRELSSGHQQLVQVAKAMVRVPSVFLLDEPLARVDATSRTRLRADLRRLQRGYQVTTLYVTNDPVEAMAVADRVAVIDAGRLVQVGAPLAVYREPDTKFVAELIGERPMNFLPGEIRVAAEGSWVIGEGFELRIWAPAVSRHDRRRVVVGVRPEDMIEDPGGTPVRRRRTTPFGDHDEVEIEIGSHRLTMRTPHGAEPRAVRFARWHVFDEDGAAIAHVD